MLAIEILAGTIKSKPTNKLGQYLKKKLLLEKSIEFRKKVSILEKSIATCDIIKIDQYNVKQNKITTKTSNKSNATKYKSLYNTSRKFFLGLSRRRFYFN